MIHYGMTKTAQLAVSRGLAETCAGTGVTVNAVLPGPTHSDGVDEFVKQFSGGKPFAEFEKEFFTNVRPSSLLQRLPPPRKWPTWWCMFAARCPPPPTARPCAWTAAWCGPAFDYPPLQVPWRARFILVWPGDFPLKFPL